MSPTPPRAANPPGRTQIQLRVEPDLLARLDSFAEMRGISRNYVMHSALAEWLADHETHMDRTETGDV